MSYRSVIDFGDDIDRKQILTYFYGEYTKLIY